MASSLNSMPPEVLKRILSFIEIPTFPLPTSSPSAARAAQSVFTVSPVDNAVLDSASPDATDARRSATEGLKTLVALALSCRALSEPALDLIWSTLPSLVPLVRTLPSDLWQEVPAEYDGGNGSVFVSGLAPANIQYVERRVADDAPRVSYGRLRPRTSLVS